MSSSSIEIFQPGSGLIVEPRKHPALKLVVLNALTKLPNNWEIVVVHGLDNRIWIKQWVDLLTEEQKKRIRLHQIPHKNLTINQYSRVMTSREIWNLPKYENVLVFQTDSLILNGSPHKLKDFMSYTFVGAPWPCARPIDKIGNGGFSFRKKSACLDAIRNCKFNRHPEDYFFIRYFNRNRKYRVSPFSVARAFSVERIFYKTPFGIHKCWRYINPAQWDSMVKITPELLELKRSQLSSGSKKKAFQENSFHQRNRYYAKKSLVHWRNFRQLPIEQNKKRGYKKPPAKNRKALS